MYIKDWPRTSSPSSSSSSYSTSFPRFEVNPRPMFPTLSSIPMALALGLVLSTGVGAVIPDPAVLHPNGDITKCFDVRGAVFENGTPVDMCVSDYVSAS